MSWSSYWGGLCTIISTSLQCKLHEVMLLPCPQNLVQCLGHSTHSLMPIDWMLEECRHPVAQWKAPSGHGYAGRSCPFALAQGQISSCNPHCWCPSQNLFIWPASSPSAVGVGWKWLTPAPFSGGLFSADKRCLVWWCLGEFMCCHLLTRLTGMDLANISSAFTL